MLNLKFDFDDYKFMVLNRAKNIDEIVFKSDEKNKLPILLATLTIGCETY